MKILFSVHHLGSFRMYEQVVRQLAARGHEVHISIGRTDNLGWGKTLDALVAEYPTIGSSWLEVPAENFWSEAAKTIRLWADYMRYFEPAYANTPILMERAADRVPAGLRWLSHRRVFRSAAWRRRLNALLRACERLMPRVAGVEELLERERPDVVLVTPLVYLGSVQTDVLRSAVAAGLPTGFCVGSWDHLSSKALLRDIPDRVFLWNETQRHEAIALHGVPSERVVVTGAQCYDQWFGRRPSRSREEFCRDIGLPADRPYLLYVGSALFRGSPVEAAFAARWVEAIRAAADPVVRDAPILIRPHPARMEEWNAVDFSGDRDVVVYGSNPVDDSSKDDYFDSLYYSAAVVGLNTSAFLEGAVVGRPVHTILLPEFHENQEGTLHFHYLFNVGGGALHGARGWDEHRAQLGRSLRGEMPAATGVVEAFVRPRGLGCDASSVFVDEVEALGRLARREPTPETAATRRLRTWVLGPTLHALRALFGNRVMRTDWSEHARERDRAHEEKERRQRELHEAAMRRRQQRGEERDARIRERDRRREAAHLAQLQARQEARAAHERAQREAREQHEREREQERLAKARAKEEAQQHKLAERAAVKSRQLEEHRARKRAAEAESEGKRA